MVRILWLIQEANPQWSVGTRLNVLSQLCPKFCANIKKMGRLKKENIPIINEWFESVRVENSKQYALKIGCILWLVVFHGISTLTVNLMQNPIYI